MKQHCMSIVKYSVIVLLCSCNVMLAQTSRGAVPVGGGSATPATPQPTTNTPDAGYSAADSLDIERLKKQDLHWSVGGDITYSAPRNDFKTIMDSLDKSWGMGFGFFGAYTFTPVPVSVGANVNFLFYGSDEKVYRTTYKVGGIPVIFNDTITTSNSIIPISVFARFEPDVKVIKPYIEALVGFTVISSSHNVKYDASVGKSYDSTSTSVPFHYGIGGGVKIKLADIYNVPISRNALYLNLQTKFLFGDYSDYTFRLYDQASNTFSIVNKSSRTDLMLINLGVSYEF